jgi:hypothetical protein
MIGRAMTLDQFRSLQVGDRVRIDVPSTGAVEIQDRLEDFTYPAGAIGTVARLDDYPAPQLRAVTLAIGMGDCIITNSWDEADFADGLVPLGRFH